MISNKYLVASDTETNNIATTVAINLATWKRTTQRQPLRSTSRPSNEQLSATLCRSRWSLTLVADSGRWRWRPRNEHGLNELSFSSLCIKSCLNVSGNVRLVASFVSFSILKAFGSLVLWWVYLSIR